MFNLWPLLLAPSQETIFPTARCPRASQLFHGFRWADSARRDALGFKRIGRVPGCGNLKSYPDRLVDAIIYGRDLTLSEEDGDDLVSEDRFEKIKFYLKHGKYPNGADRAEKSRLRSAATHYKLLENDVLMLKDKEVISDPASQYEIARQTHALGQHAGINKTTATITERYHWRGIKDTVSDVIRVCVECEDKSNVGLLKPSTPIQTSVPHPPPPPPSSVSSVFIAAKSSLEDVRHKDSPPGPKFYQQESKPSSHSPFDHNELPTDPQIMNHQQPYLPAQGSHSDLYDQPDQNLQHPYFGPHTEINLEDPEAHALLHLISATSPIHEEENCEISDQDLEMMLTRQLEEEADSGGERMEVDSNSGSFLDH